MRKQKVVGAKNFDELLDLKYGKVGSKNRNSFEKKAQHFVVKETREKGHQ